MDAAAIVERLVREFPQGTVKMIPPQDPLEIVLELPGTPEEGRAIAVIDRSVPHVHRRTTERYDIQEGTLQLHLDGTLLTIGPGESVTILPGQVHWAVGQATRLLVTSWPPWTRDDHIICEPGVR
jgi:mannose-6-phosphate isomerase-like protein (cupin superfamily)